MFCLCYPETLQLPVSSGPQQSDFDGLQRRAVLLSGFWQETGVGGKWCCDTRAPRFLSVQPWLAVAACLWRPQVWLEGPPTASSPANGCSFCLWLSSGRFTLQAAYFFEICSFITLWLECAICVLPFQGQKGEGWAVLTQGSWSQDSNYHRYFQIGHKAKVVCLLFRRHARKAK